MIEKRIDFGIAYVVVGSMVGLVIFGIALTIIIKIFKDIIKNMEDDDK